MPVFFEKLKGRHPPFPTRARATFAQVEIDVATLTRAERHRLRSLLVQSHKSSALELREIIYRLVLMSSSGTVRRLYSPGRHKKSKAKPPPNLPTSILQVSRQIYLEARNILYTETECRLSIYLQFYRIGYQIERNDKLAFTNFRKVVLAIHVTGTYILYDDETVGSLGRFLADLVDTLALAFDSRSNIPKRTLELNFRFGRADDMVDAQDVDQNTLYRLIWYRTQLSSAVKKMRNLLLFEPRAWS